MIERWQPVRGYACCYEVSDAGRVRAVGQTGHRAEGLILRQAPSTHGPYLRVRLVCRDGKRRRVFVAGLVARAFLPRRPTRRHQVNHADGRKEHNCAANLGWLTPRQNTLHAHRAGLVPRTAGRGER